MPSFSVVSWSIKETMSITFRAVATTYSRVERSYSGSLGSSRMAKKMAMVVGETINSTITINGNQLRDSLLRAGSVAFHIVPD